MTDETLAGELWDRFGPPGWGRPGLEGMPRVLREHWVRHAREVRLLVAADAWAEGFEAGVAAALEVSGP